MITASVSQNHLELETTDRLELLRIARLMWELGEHIELQDPRVVKVSLTFIRKDLTNGTIEDTLSGTHTEREPQPTIFDG